MKIVSAQTANEWPPSSALPRLKRYEKLRAMWDGRHSEAFEYARGMARLAQAEGETFLYLVFNFCRLVSKAAADFLFGEAPKISGAPDIGDTLDWLLQQTQFHRTNYFHSLNNSVLGDALYKVRLIGGDNPRVSIDRVRPSLYFPELDPDDQFRVESHILAWTRRMGDTEYLRVERQQPGIIENHLYALRGGEIDREVPLDAIYNADEVPPLVETGVDAPLIVHVPNMQFDEFWGISDLADLESLQDECNNRLSQLAEVLDKHADPYMYAPEGTEDENCIVRAQRYKMFLLGPDEEAPGYVQWDANLESAFREIEQLVEMMFYVTETSPAAFGVKGDQAAESGRALKFRLMRTVAASRRKAMFYGPAIRQVLSLAFRLARAHNVKFGDTVPPDAPPEAFSIGWRDGIPNDEFEIAQTQQLRMTAGLTSTTAALRRLMPDATDAEIEAEATAIRNEEIASTGTTNFGAELAV